MSKPLAISNIVGDCRERWQALPDYRKPNNNMRYAIADAALAALAVFFMQSASFLAHQRDMALRKRRNNGRTLFGIEKIPSDNPLRNLLDPLTPDHFQADFDWVMAEMAAAGSLDAFRAYHGTWLVALDGLTYHSSTTVHCANCSQRQDSQGTTHYYHSVITPVLVTPGSPHVLPLPPEFIVPHDGHEKQDCERAAVKRWLAAQHTHYQPDTVTDLGDDLYANQPGCQLIAETYQQYFVFVCKPDSHVALYSELALLDKIGGVTTLTTRHWNGRAAEISTYRFANHVPLRAGAAALLVDWCELPVTSEATGAVLFHNAWVTNHRSLNLFAFLVHTAQHLTNQAYRLLRETLAVRRTFFNDLKALTRYIVFDSWEALFNFMLDGLELTIPPPAT